MTLKMYWSSLNVLVVCPFGLITVAFAMLYWAIGTTANFEGGLSRASATYFVLGTLTTAGTGTITLISDLARAFVSVQMIVDLVYVAVALTITVTRWSERSS